jgi:hypothetical protein
MNKLPLFFVLFLANVVFGSISTVAVSPFVNGRFSGTYVFSYFPMWDYDTTGSRYPFSIPFYYEKEAIVITQTSYESYYAENGYFSLAFGDRVELELGLGYIMLSSQIKVKVFNYNFHTDYSFFRNIAISPFFGQFFKRATSGFRGRTEVNFYNDIYGGISIGTKQSAGKYFEFELYTSPLIYNSKCGINVRASSFIHNDVWYGNVDLLTLNIPVGAKMLIGDKHKVSIDFGFIPIIKLKETWLETSPVAAFTKASFHLGRESRLWK